MGHPDQGVSVLAGTAAWDRKRPDNSELPDLDVRDIFVVDESLGRVWFATRQGAALYDQRTDTWPRFITRAMIPEVIRDNITSVAVDSGGRLWLGLLNEGVVHSANLVTWVQVGTSEGLGSEEVRDLLVASNGDVWVATASGVSRVVDGVVTTYTTGNSALPADGNQRAGGNGRRARVGGDRRRGGGVRRNDVDDVHHGRRPVQQRDDGDRGGAGGCRDVGPARPALPST